MTWALAQTTVSIIVACISAAVAIATLVWYAASEANRRRYEHEEKEADRHLEAEKLVRRYREPLVFSADQLLNRIDNIRNDGFLQKWGTVRRDYVVASTTYAIGELLGWMELLRQNQQFLDLGEEDATRMLNECLAAIGRAFSTDKIVDADGAPASFMIWRQEQRAIGELMIDSSADQARCIAYATFHTKMQEPTFSVWFANVGRDASEAIDGPGRALPRLEEVAAAAGALIDELDSRHVLAPKR